MFDAPFEAKPIAAIPRPHCVLRLGCVVLDTGRNDSMARQILPGSGN
jgi:hypothetical protein